MSNVVALNSLTNPHVQIANLGNIAANDLIVCCGRVQEGKTQALVRLQHQAYLQGKSIVHLVKSTGCSTELDQYSSSMAAWATLNDPGWVTQVALKTIQYTNCGLISWATDKAVRKRLVDLINIPGAVIVVTANAPQMGKVADIIRLHNAKVKNKYIISLDEADLVFEHLVGQTTKAEDHLAYLSKHSFASVAATATYFPYLFAPIDAQKNLRFVSASTSGAPYKGAANGVLHPHIIHHPINNTGVVTKKGSQATFDPVAAFQELDDFIKDLERYHRQHNRVYAMINVTRLRAGHAKIKTFLLSRWPAVIADQYTILVMNDSTISVTYPNQHSLAGSTVDFPGKTYGEVITELVLDPEHTHRVITIAGDMAGRGIRFSDTTYKYHLTHQYYVAATSSAGERVYQAMRCFGVFYDNLPIHLYCDNDTLQNILDQNKQLDDFLANHDNLSRPTGKIVLSDALAARPLARPRLHRQLIEVIEDGHLKFPSMAQARQWCVDNGIRAQLLDHYIPLNFLPDMKTVVDHIAKHHPQHTPWEMHKNHGASSPWYSFDQKMKKLAHAHYHDPAVPASDLRSRIIVREADARQPIIRNYTRFEFILVGSTEWTPSSGFAMIVKQINTIENDEDGWRFRNGPWLKHDYDGGIILGNHGMHQVAQSKA
jgi:hypothetical protein